MKKPYKKRASIIDVAVDAAGLEAMPDPKSRTRTRIEDCCLDAAIVAYKNLGLPDNDVMKLIPGVNPPRIYRAMAADVEMSKNMRVYAILKIRLENHLK